MTYRTSCSKLAQHDFYWAFFGAENQKASSLIVDIGLPSLEHSSKPVH